MAQLQERLVDRVGKEVFFYSISIDPGHDTPDKMKKYAETFGAGPGWMFPDGHPEDINLIRQRLGERSRFLGEHATTFFWAMELRSVAKATLDGDMERLSP
jgi:cytochrome oxidase Cu insertion factor (SCO1/SenC/PrrC family)